MLKSALKAIFHAVFLVLSFPMAAVSAFGRWEAAFNFFAQLCAGAPGLPGDYLRIAYYRLTLDECSLNSRISFGSFYAQPQVRVAAGVYVGAYCVIGQATIGERTQIASAVQITSGRHQHARESSGAIGAEAQLKPVSIGSDCWIGTAAVVMDDIGAGSTIGAGAIVTRPIPPGSVAVGNPARVIRSSVPAAGEGEKRASDEDLRM